jgi:AraC-like DNA-binding protein
LNNCRARKFIGVARARQFIEDHQTDDLSLTKEARAVNTSTFYFCKLFKKATGLNHTEYLSQLRIEKAKKSAAKSKSPRQRNRLRNRLPNTYSLQPRVQAYHQPITDELSQTIAIVRFCLTDAFSSPNRATQRGFRCRDSMADIHSESHKKATHDISLPLAVLTAF